MSPEMVSGIASKETLEFVDWNYSPYLALKRIAGLIRKQSGSSASSAQPFFRLATDRKTSQAPKLWV